MGKAHQVMVLNLPVLADTAPAAKALEALAGAGCGVVGIRVGNRLEGLITPLSAAAFPGCPRCASRSTAKDLGLEDLPLVDPESGLDTVLAAIREYGVAGVRGSAGELAGAITASSLVVHLVGRADELERELDAVINFSSDEILVADGRGSVLRANSVFEENFGVPLAGVLGKTVDELEKKKIFYPSVTRLVLDKRTPQTIIQSRKDGRKLLATGTPAFNEDGSVFRVIVNTRDITRLNDLQKKLEESELLKNRYQQELVELRQGNIPRGDLVARSPAMIELVRVARRIAEVDSTVLLTGESGSGKGMVARYIHSCSPRRNKLFTVVNCGAIPETLLESELFGYAGGAFTGARREGRIGKLELANGGTLFLDEITELSLGLQVKLLHVLQEGLISPVGGTREIKLNLRFIAATNSDIVGLVRAGRFREDLFFRLDVMPLQVPPLRDRREDIGLLTEHFLDKLGRRYGRRKSFSPEVLACLERHRWPGNVRELENLVERMIVVSDESTIGVRHLPRHVVSGTESLPLGTAPSKHGLKPLREVREAAEKDLLAGALDCCRTTYEIAEALDVDQSTVVRKLKKYKLAPPERA